MVDKELLKALAVKTGKPVMSGKGGFFVKDKGFISTAKARKLTGIAGKTRQPRIKQLPWGDYATIAMINQPRIRITPKRPRLS